MPGPNSVPVAYDVRHDRFVVGKTALADARLRSGQGMTADLWRRWKGAGGGAVTVTDQARGDGRSDPA